MAVDHLTAIRFGSSPAAVIALLGAQRSCACTDSAAMPLAARGRA